MSGPDIQARLLAAINECCDVRGDDAKNRAALLGECSALPVDQQADLILHFEDQARMFGAFPDRNPRRQRKDDL